MVFLAVLGSGGTGFPLIFPLVSVSHLLCPLWLQVLYSAHSSQVVGACYMNTIKRNVMGEVLVISLECGQGKKILVSSFFLIFNTVEAQLTG